MAIQKEMTTESDNRIIYFKGPARGYAVDLATLFGPERLGGYIGNSGLTSGNNMAPSIGGSDQRNTLGINTGAGGILGGSLLYIAGAVFLVLFLFIGIKK